MKLLFCLCFVIFSFLPNMVYANLYDVETITVQKFSETIVRTGKLDYRRTLTLSFKSSGYLSDLNVDEGDLFSKGQQLASLDITELSETKNSHYSQLIQAKREVKRIQQLMTKNLATERELDVATTNVDTSRAAYQVSYYNLERATIYAPFDGMVLQRHTEYGEFQQPGSDVLRVASSDENWVIKVALSSNEIANITRGQEVDVSLPNIEKLKGVVTKIPAMANSQGSLFTIEVFLPSLKFRTGIIAGQIAEVSIKVQSDTYVYAIPNQALISVNQQGKAVIFSQVKPNESYTKDQLDIYGLDNSYIYVKAKEDSKPVTLITRGWQHYTNLGSN